MRDGNGPSPWTSASSPTSTLRRLKSQPTRTASISSILLTNYLRLVYSTNAHESAPSGGSTRGAIGHPTARTAFEPWPAATGDALPPPKQERPPPRGAPQCVSPLPAGKARALSGSRRVFGTSKVEPHGFVNRRFLHLCPGACSGSADLEPYPRSPVRAITGPVGSAGNNIEFGPRAEAPRPPLGTR